MAIKVQEPSMISDKSELTTDTAVLVYDKDYTKGGLRKLKISTWQEVLNVDTARVNKLAQLTGYSFTEYPPDQPLPVGFVDTLTKVDNLLGVVGISGATPIEPSEETIKDSISSLKTDVTSIESDIERIDDSIPENLKTNFAQALIDIETNKTDIASDESRIGTLEGKVSTIESQTPQIETNKTDISNLTTRVTSVETEIGDNNVSGSIKKRITDNESEISSIKDRLNTDETNLSNTTISLNSHIATTTNPHNVTKSQVGLGNVDNEFKDSSIIEDESVRSHYASVGAVVDYVKSNKPIKTISSSSEATDNYVYKCDDDTILAGSVELVTKTFTDIVTLHTESDPTLEGKTLINNGDGTLSWGEGSGGGTVTYPVGTVVELADGVDPNDIYEGTWVQL